MAVVPRDEEDVCHLLDLVHIIQDSESDVTAKKDALHTLSLGIQPQNLPPEGKQLFLEALLAKTLVNDIVCLIEQRSALGIDACDFLGDLCFNSDLGTRMALEHFDRIVACFGHIFKDSGRTQVRIDDESVRSFVSLCANIVATSPQAHKMLIPLVGSLFLRIIQDPKTPDRLLSSTILLLANLALTNGPELSKLSAADALMKLVLDREISCKRKSVAESVVIFLYGHHCCTEIDQLLEFGVIEDYCVPILRNALTREPFRGMYPHLVYSVRLFQLLAQSRVYAEALASHDQVIPLLLKASLPSETRAQLESDTEGRRLALEALRSLAQVGFWPPPTHDDIGLEAGALAQESDEFICHKLPLLLDEDCVDVRAAASGVWAFLNKSYIYTLLLVGTNLSEARCLPRHIWRYKILAFLFPLLAEVTADGYYFSRS